MKTIQDAMEVQRLVEKYRIRERFDTEGLAFRGLIYQKGEVLCSPVNPTSSLLFLVEGNVQMYSLRPDGSKLPVAQSSGEMLIGDLEYITGQPTVFFVEAVEECICLALPAAPYREALSRDLRFLHSLLGSVASKFTRSADGDLYAATLEERVLRYLRDEVPAHEIHEVETLLYQLRCGRRQLQRVLRKLCDDGALVRLGKGHYQIAS